ncbi:DNA primase family protein [Lichenifustis flavocetrariae]|uniref:Phage/plasmid primase, P4 family n=1 Tax=Lichenifustis flavocetrariae TaxID=2949735 RepID=A0AA42CJS6_9HYPH|nr:phage/plasmid primase, P4 family [Lichenifustis flavocetrariae]MCW6509799.1 phage/plasmid primase, P4 family [Lichenifustis flavocetrariae]
MSDEIVKRVAGAEVLQFPRGKVPAETQANAPNASASAADRLSRGTDPMDRAFGEAGHGGGAGGDGASRDRELGFLALTDLGNAERFHRRYSGQLLFCRAIGWLAWDGRRWQRDGADERVGLAEHATVRAIQDEAKTIRGSADDFVVADASRSKPPVWYSDKVAAWGRASENASRMGVISKRAAAMFAIPVTQLDRDPMRINVLNGTLLVRKSDDDPYVVLSPHDPADLITKLAPVTFDREADCPRFDAFLLRVQPDDTARHFLAQWGGLSLTGDVGVQKMTFHYGKGRNGKGVWVNTVSFVAGDYSDSIPIESFLDSGRARAGGQATPDIAGLPGVRMLTTSEPKKGAQLDEAFVKLFTGGDKLKARHLNKDYFEFFPQAKLTMQGNYRPKISGTDEGIWGRMILVPWPVFIPEGERNPQLVEELKREASGILNRLLDGLCAWLDRGLLIPAAVSAATEAYRSDSDPLGRFLEFCTRPEIGKRVQAADMHAVFVAWAKLNGETEYTPKGLGSALRERGFAEKKSSVQYWLDIVLTKGVSDFLDASGKPLHGAADSPEAAREEDRS